MNLRRLVAVLRLARASWQQRAAEANADGRPCCALTLWHVGQDVAAFEQRLREEPNP